VKALRHAQIPANLLFADDHGGLARCPIQPVKTCVAPSFQHWPSTARFPDKPAIRAGIR
jgi:hypothetical protein